MDYLRAVKKAHPEIRFFLLTNFPNWGYRGNVSYHARGPKRQDWGGYHDVVTTVLAAAKEEGLTVAGVTADNPYEYLVGQHSASQPPCLHFVSCGNCQGTHSLASDRGRAQCQSAQARVSA